MLYDVTINGKNYRVELNRADGHWSCRLDGRDAAVDAVLVRPDVLSLRIGNKAYEVKSERVGDDLQAGAGVAVVEAMKMQNEIKSPKKGTVQKILVSEGSAVNAGDILAIVE